MTLLYLFLLSFLFTYLIAKYAIKNELVAEVTQRSLHSVPTPHGGGIAIAITWFIGLFYLYFQNAIDCSLFFALLSGVIISIVSYLDDLYELSPKIRLLAQALVSLLGLYFLGGFREVDLFIFTLNNQLLTNIFAFFMIIWFINLYNFLDGIDGFAGSEAIFLGIAGFLLFSGAHFLVLIVSVLGFLVWNWHKAKIFMGDVGSTLLGYNVAVFTIYYGNLDSKNFWIWIILFGLFWFDATLTLLRRKINGEKLSIAHKKHAYQRMAQAGYRHDRVVLMAMVVNIILFVIVYSISNIFVAFVTSMILLYGIIKFVDYKKVFE